MSEVPLKPWPNAEVHADLQQTLTLPYHVLLAHTVEHLFDAADHLDGLENYSRDSPLELVKRNMVLARNAHVVETVGIYVARDSVTAAYESNYTGDIGRLVRPGNSWAVAHEAGEYFYWSQARHGENAAIFALAGTECDEVDEASLAVRLMKYYVSAGLYLRDHPHETALGISLIPEPDMKAAFGITDELIRRSLISITLCDDL